MGRKIHPYSARYLSAIGFSKFRVRSNGSQAAVLAYFNNLVRIAFPPIELGENLDLVETVITGGLDPAPQKRDINHAVSHHTTIKEEITRRHKPVADVKGKQSFLAPALDLAL